MRWTPVRVSRRLMAAIIPYRPTGRSAGSGPSSGRKRHFDQSVGTVQGLNLTARGADKQLVHREPDELDLALAPILPTVCGSVAMLDAVWMAVDLITLRGHWMPWLAAVCGLSALLLAG